MAKAPGVVLEVAGREVTVTNPDKPYFPEAGHRKLDVVRYYLAVADGALRGAGGRPNVLKRFVDGAAGEPFYQKRVPDKRPAWLDTVVLRYPSGRTAEEVVPRDAAALAWMVNLGCLELHPHPVRADDLEHPDELRLDLDPTPGVEWPQLREVAAVVRATCDDLGLIGWPKTSGSRGIHVNVRLHRRWSYDQVRGAAQAFAREVERRAPALATSRWWKEERHGVFLDYNQNARDRTVCSAYSARPRPDARVSAPVTWEELAACEPGDFTIATMPARYAAIGDPHAGIDEAPCELDALLELAARQGPAPGPAMPARGGRRQSVHPLVEIGRAADREAALAGLERWKARHPEVAAHLAPDDVLVDAMRGRFRTWTRCRATVILTPLRQQN